MFVQLKDAFDKVVNVAFGSVIVMIIIAIVIGVVKLVLSILDAAIIFIIRELLIGLFKHNLEPEMLYALSAFLFVIGALRIASIVVYLKEKELNDLVCEGSK